MEIKNISGDVIYSLEGADLRGKDLRCADLRGADLRGKDLRGADIEGANLEGANLEDAWFTLLNIPNQKYSVSIRNNEIKIGCKQYSIEEWENFSDRDILKMDGRDGLEWWKEWKDVVISTAKLYIKQIQKQQEKK